MWTIEAKRLPIALSGHLYIDIFDDWGTRVYQINGFGRNRQTGNYEALGNTGDHLSVKVDQGAEGYLAASA